MNSFVLAFLGWPEIVGILIIVLVLFGARKVPELMRGLGHGLKEFKKATRDVQEDIQQAMEEEPPPPPKKVPPVSSSEADGTVPQSTTASKP